MIRPTPLKAGDRVGIVATARRIKSEDVEAAVRVLEGWGLAVTLSPHLYNSSHSYLAGTDEERISALQQFLDGPELKAIFCARGGYGTTRIIDELDFRAFVNNPKWIVGYSDITSLHLKISALGIESIHGTMPIMFGRDDVASSLHALRQLLFGEPQAPTARQSSFNKPGKGTGQLTGGNLSLLADSIGTSHELETKGKILILEEVDEFMYRIDRMVVQLKRAGKLDALAGLAVGHFSDIKDSESFGETVEEIIRYHTRELSYPIGFNFPIGHIHPNEAWICGRDAILDVTTLGASILMER